MGTKGKTEELRVENRVGGWGRIKFGLKNKA